MNEQKVGLWDGAEVVSVYTRAQALEDGVLVDLTAYAREAGFTVPLAVTRGVWAVLEPSKELEAGGEDVAGRAWDMLTILRQAIRSAGGGDTVHFAPLFTLEPGRAPEGVELWARMGPDDACGPCITVMLRGED